MDINTLENGSKVATVSLADKKKNHIHFKHRKKKNLPKSYKKIFKWNIDTNTINCDPLDSSYILSNNIICSYDEYELSKCQEAIMKIVNKITIQNSYEWFLVDLKRGVFTSLDKEFNPSFGKYKIYLFALTKSKEAAKKLCAYKYFFQSINPSNTWITNDHNFITNCISSYYLIAANAQKLHNYDLKKYIDILFTINEKEIICKSVYGYYYLIKDSELNHSSKVNKAQQVQNKINYYKTQDIFKLLKQKNVLTELQLIKGANNHCSKNHTVRCKAVEIIFYDYKQHCFNTYTIAVQYCENCKRYFDFYNSFIGQLEMYHIPTNALHVNCYDQHHRKIKFPSQTLSYELQQETLLHRIGYVVGQNGLTTSKRQELLLKIITYKVMTPSDLKHKLEWNINYYSNNPKMYYAVKCWKEDINFINKQIINKHLTYF